MYNRVATASTTAHGTAVSTVERSGHVMSVVLSVRNATELPLPGRWRRKAISIIVRRTTVVAGIVDCMIAL
jgi:hypothetical protein